MWNNFKGLNPKVLAATDVLETIQMRLTSFFENTSFILSCKPITFGPFVGGLTILSFQNLISHQSMLTTSANVENKCCAYAMSFAERKYVEDLMLKGLDLLEDQIDQSMVNLTKKCGISFYKVEGRYSTK